MAFVGPEPRAPTAIGRLVVSLIDQPEITEGLFPQPAEQSAWYTLEVLDQDGAVIPFPGASGNLVPHLTSQEIQALLAFIADLRTQAEQQILGGE